MSEKLVVLDTNVFGVGANLGSPLWLSLKRLCAELGIVLCVPDVVFRESVNIRREQYREAEKEFLEANKKIGRFYDLPGVYVPDADEVAAKWEGDLETAFRILESSAEDALEALSREASRIPPARGGRGARDSLIWLTCRRLAEAGNEIFLVSRNTKDFADKDGDSLHPSLAAEVTNAAGQLTYFSSLDAFFDALATRTDGPDLTETDMLQQLVGFELWDFAVDVLDARDHVGAEFLQMDLELSDVRSLRAYEVDERGLALIDGQALVAEGDGHRSVAMKFMAWIEFDLESKEVLAAEIEHIAQGTP